MNRARFKDRLIKDEGSVPYAYEDSEGYLTIGVGRLIDKRKGGKLSDDEIEYLLDNDIDKVINQAIRAFPWYQDMDDVRQEVVLNMIFNLGIAGFSRFKHTIEAIARHDFVDASREMLDSRWASQVGNRALRLSEAMRTGEWSDN